MTPKERLQALIREFNKKERQGVPHVIMYAPVPGAADLATMADLRELLAVPDIGAQGMMQKRTLRHQVLVVNLLRQHQIPENIIRTVEEKMRLLTVGLE